MKQKILILTALLALFFTQQALAKFVYTKEGLWGAGNKYALSGYDATAYFLQNKPEKGSEKHSLKYKNETWLFTSEKNKQLFQENPKKYAPQYGGHCAWREAQDGKEVYGDPQVWTIVNDKLYLNYNKAVNNKWDKNIPNFIKKADAYWLKEFESLN